MGEGKEGKQTPDRGLPRVLYGGSKRNVTKHWWGGKGVAIKVGVCGEGGVGFLEGSAKPTEDCHQDCVKFHEVRSDNHTETTHSHMEISNFNDRG